MANKDRPNGFRFAKSLTGAPVSAMIRLYNVDSSNSTAVFLGDAVTLEADGNVAPAASGNTILGVVVGVGVDNVDHGETGYYNPANLEQRHLPGSTAGIVGVIPAEGNLFEVQTATALDLAQGDPADLSAGAGSTTTGVSAHEITTASNNDVKVVEQVTTPDNDTSLVNARYIVMFPSVEHAI